MFAGKMQQKGKIAMFFSEAVSHTKSESKRRRKEYELSRKQVH